MSNIPCAIILFSLGDVSLNFDAALLNQPAPDQFHKLKLFGR